jgi:rubrerythrin
MNQTIQNLTKAFIGESQARNRYTFYARVAQKEGYEQICDIFTVTAENEKIHAKRLFEAINQMKKDNDNPDAIMVEADAPTIYGTTIENLKAAIAGEHHEHSSMYPEFAEIAQNEGFPEIAARLRAIAIAEEHHEERYKKLLKELEAGTVFKKKKETWWICRECGYMHFGKEPPVKCPACDHPTAFYQVKCEEY